MSNPFEKLGGKEISAPSANPFEKLGGKEVSTPVSAPAEEGVDEGLVNKIMTTAGVDRAEAVRRAKNTAALLKEPNRPTLSAGKSMQEEYGDIPSVIGTAIEGAMSAVPWVGPFLKTLEGNLGDVLETEYGMTDNPLTSENIRRREETNPITSIGTEVVGNLATAAAGVAKSVAPKFFYSDTPLAKTTRALETLDLPGKVASKMSAKAGAKMLGSTFEEEVGKVAEEIGALERRAAGEAVGDLTKGEQEVLDLYQAARKTRTQDIVESKFRRGYTPENVAVERALEDRTKFVIQQKLDDSLKALGYEAEEAAKIAERTASVFADDPSTRNRIIARLSSQRAAETKKVFDTASRKQFVEKAVKVSGVPTAVVSGISAATTSAAKELRESKTITKEEADAMGETAAADMLSSTAAGASLGFALGAFSPFAAKGFELASRGVSKALQKVSQTIIPKIGEWKTGTDASRYGAALDAAEYLAETNTKREMDKLINALQFQFDEAEPYAERLRGVRKMLAHDAAQSLDMHLEEGLARDGVPAKPLAPNLKDRLDDIRKKFMIQDDNGKWVYSKNKLMDYFKNKELRMYRTPDGSVYADLSLPEEIYALETEMSGWSMVLHGQQGKYRAQGLSNTSFEDLQGMIQDVAPIPPNRLGRVNIRGGEQSGVAPIYNQMPEYPIAGISREGFPMEIEQSSLDFLVKGKLKELAGSKIDRPFDAKEAAQLLIPTIILQEFGLDLLPAGAAAYLGKKALDLLNDPVRAIEAYQAAQTILFKSSEMSRNFSKYLTSTPQAATAAANAINILSQKQEGKNPLSLTDAGAREIYAQDKKFLERFATGDTLQQVEDVFSGDLDVLDNAYPSLATSAGQTLPRQIAFLNEKYSAIQPKGWDEYNQGEYKPTRQQLFSYALYSRYVRNPDTIYTDIAKKRYVPDQALEVLQKVYPARLNQLRKQILDEVANGSGKPSKEQQLILSKILGTNPYKMTPDEIQTLQKSFQQETPAAGTGGGVSNRRVELERQGTSQQ